MKLTMFLKVTLAAGYLLVSIGTGAAAALNLNVVLDTSPLIGNGAAPFTLEFQLNDGSGAGDTNNTVTLSNFQFGGGSASGSPILTSGASGSLGSVVTITDSSFFNSFVQQFVPGTQLEFNLMLSTNVDAGFTPDQFSFAILDQAGVEIPTQGAAATGSDVLLSIDIDSSTPTVRTFATDPFRFPSGGAPIDMAAPNLVPEPGTWALATSALVLLALGLARRSRVGCIHQRRTKHSFLIVNARLKSGLATSTIKPARP